MLIIFLTKLCFRDGLAIEHFENSNKKIHPQSRDHLSIIDSGGKKLNVILISKPFQGDHEVKIYENKDKNIFVGSMVRISPLYQILMKISKIIIKNINTKEWQKVGSIVSVSQGLFSTDMPYYLQGI